MASFNDLITIANDGLFQNRVLYALEVAAIAVLAEAGAVTGHSARVSYANKVIQNGSSAASIAARGVLTNLALAAEADITKTQYGDYGISDGDIQFVVNGLFSSFAGVAN